MLRFFLSLFLTNVSVPVEYRRFVSFQVIIYHSCSIEVLCLPFGVSRGKPRGATFAQVVRGCACRTTKFWLSLYLFFGKFPTHQYTNFVRKAPNFAQIGLFLPKFLKIHPIYANWAPWSVKNTPHRYTNFCEKAPQKAGTCTYTKSMWEPLPPGSSTGKLLGVLP